MILNHISFANLMNSNEMTKKNEPKDFFTIIYRKVDLTVLWYGDCLFAGSVLFAVLVAKPGIVG
jgi:hypothetical protein